MNELLIKIITQRIRDFYREEYPILSDSFIKRCFFSWKGHLEKPEDFAAVIMTYGPFSPSITQQEIKDCREFFFPSTPTEINADDMDEDEYNQFLEELYQQEQRWYEYNFESYMHW